MKTGRVRKKIQPGAEAMPETAAPAAAPPAVEALGPTPGLTLEGPSPRPRVPVGLIVAGVAGVLVLLLILALVLGSGRGKREWVPATRADGLWTTNVAVFGPQLSVVEGWQADCERNPGAALRADTCVLRDTQQYRDNVVDEYEEYAYDIYHEETSDQIYQAQGSEFAVTELGSDEWWEGNRHYTRQEQLDPDSCKLSNYTVWVEDPDDPSQEVEVYLAQCQIWDQVTITERVYEQAPWCQCDVTTLVPMAQLSDQGSGTLVRWPGPTVPSGGRADESFSGRVTFAADNYSYTVTTTDPEEYERLLTGQYYIGLTGGDPVEISATPPQQ